MEAIIVLGVIFWLGPVVWVPLLLIFVVGLVLLKLMGG
jgi:hypothetical protein